ncbi:MAG TPA: DUF1343 domain-containing protein [Ohtaekwangia sp.]|uniref:exo-beta-N-acetylmuramidase NamZ family protein n=1 Tax=Ohtaekwangia sp. TaxID=2066019 RepID=UPI002F91EA87
MKIKIAFTLLHLLGVFACLSPKTTTPPVKEPPVTQQPAEAPKADTRLALGAEQLDILLQKLGTQRVALVVNQTSVIGKTHLADTLKSRGANLIKIFGPEHGFRGAAADGEHVKDGVDTKTGLPVVSLYGKNYKATPAQLSDIDIVVFDIQDVGARFYTYISTMHYMMEACAENNKKMIILDRPNPNAYVDGPINQTPLKSFVAMHAIPIAHGLTVAELALMINGEGWLTNHVICNVEIVPMKNWKHSDSYSLPVKPSPNLPNDQAIRLYPSICLFEGTVISLGRGTQIPFQVLGNPELKNMPFQFTPVSIPGMSVTPPLEGKVCYGLDLRNVQVERRIDLKYLIQLYNAYPEKEKFFLPYFDTLTGNTVLKQQIKEGKTEEQIRETWKADLDNYKKKREKYLLYP